jgi:hypothetical protein
VFDFGFEGHAGIGFEIFAHENTNRDDMLIAPKEGFDDGRVVLSGGLRAKEAFLPEAPCCIVND